jgi:hypothetical protein
VRWHPSITGSLYLKGAEYPATLEDALVAGNIRLDLFNVLVDKGESDERAFEGAIREFPLEFMKEASFAVLPPEPRQATLKTAHEEAKPAENPDDAPLVPKTANGWTFGRNAALYSHDGNVLCRLYYDHKKKMCLLIRSPADPSEGTKNIYSYHPLWSGALQEAWRAVHARSDTAAQNLLDTFSWENADSIKASTVPLAKEAQTLLKTAHLAENTSSGSAWLIIGGIACYRLSHDDACLLLYDPARKQWLTMIRPDLWATKKGDVTGAYHATCAQSLNYAAATLKLKSGKPKLSAITGIHLVDSFPMNVEEKLQTSLQTIPPGIAKMVSSINLRETVSSTLEVLLVLCALLLGLGMVYEFVFHANFFSLLVLLFIFVLSFMV